MTPARSQTTKAPAAAKGKKGGGKNQGVPYKCIDCKAEVSNDQKAMQCDACDEYIHIGCDKDLPEKVYDVLTKHKNPLIYLCPVCKPKITIKNNGLEIEGKINDLSKQISLVNSDIKAYTTAQVIQIKQIEDKVDEMDVQSKYTALSNRFQEMETKMNDMYQQMLHIGQEQEHTCSSLETLKATQEKMTTNVSETEDGGDEKCEGEWQTVTRKRRSKQKHVSSDMPTQDDQQTGKYDRTLVLYNTRKQRNDMDMVQRIAAHHQISPNEVLGVRRIDKGKFPLEVEVRSVYIKWMLIKEVNRSKLEGIYARPYMTIAQLNDDRELAKKLHELRAKNSNQEYKIIKGEIVIRTGVGYEKVKECDLPKN